LWQITGSLLSPRVRITKGHGGSESHRVDLHAAYLDYTYVTKTDVKQHYESIDHTMCSDSLIRNIAITYLAFVGQFVKRTVEEGRDV
jgi:hypothetical protein